MSSSLAQLLTATAAEHADRPALKLDDSVLNYAVLNEAATRVAGLLKKQGVDPDVPVAVEAMSSWVLFAQSAAACGDDLTVGCVIGTAKRQKAFEAGGLVGPVDISDPLAAPCEMIISGSAAGYRYDREMTRPTDGLYNCDRSNVVELAP